MTRTIEAVVEKDGQVRLLKPVAPGVRRRALVIIFEEPTARDETAILSESALQDWNRPEEDTAWSHLQPER